MHAHVTTMLYLATKGDRRACWQAVRAKCEVYASYTWKWRVGQVLKGVNCNIAAGCTLLALSALQRLLPQHIPRLASKHHTSYQAILEPAHLFVFRRAWFDLVDLVTPAAGITGR